MVRQVDLLRCRWIHRFLQRDPFGAAPPTPLRILVLDGGAAGHTAAIPLRSVPRCCRSIGPNARLGGSSDEHHLPVFGKAQPSMM